jgi:homoserine O-acetyltransferase
VQYFTPEEPLVLEGGGCLPQWRICFQTWGRIQGDNVVWIFHALTANADAADWWSGLVGPGKLFDPAHYFIVCANMLGSCYGTIGPASVMPDTGRPYGPDFPAITIRDMVACHRRLAGHLGVNRIHIGIGGSMGGQQLLEWAASEPDRFGHIVALATNARHSPWGIAFNEAQRMAIRAGLHSGNARAAELGLEAARAIAMLSYRNYHTYRITQNEESDAEAFSFRASTYQRYQGEKLRKRFDLYSYLCLSRAMDSHHIGRGRNGEALALSSIRAKALVVSISTDVLFPLEEQVLLVRHIPDARLAVMDSVYGHDGFLIEFEKISQFVAAFLEGRQLPHRSNARRHYLNADGTALPGSEPF